MHNIEKAFIQIYVCLVLALFLWGSINTIRFPFGANYGEAPIIDQVRRIENGGTLYKSNLDVPPYIIANYPPLYPYWIAATNFITKIPLFQTGRITSLFFSLLSGYIIGLFSYHLTENKWFGVFSAALFWGNPYVMIWSSLARVDLMALAFSLLGLWILYRYSDSKMGFVLACICFLASAFTRQTYLLSGPLAGLVWLWHQNHRRAFVFIFLIGISSLLIFGMINAITKGGFYTNIVVANINRYELSRTLLMFKQLVVIWPIILIISALTIFMIINKSVRRKDKTAKETNQASFMVYGLGFYSLGAIITALTVGKVGSDVNYFLELISVCAIWCVLMLKTFLEQAKVIKLVFLGLLSIQLIWILLAGYTLIRTSIGIHWNNLANSNDLYTQVREATSNGIVLSDDYLDLVVLSGQSIYYQPFEYGQLYLAGLWDPSKFTNEINQRLFPLVLIGGNTLNKECCWAPSLVHALEMNYRINSDNDVLILKPLK